MRTFEEKLKFYRLTSEEYQKAKNSLGRDLLDIEWPLFSALWSEHCSYKSSKIHLRKFSYRNQNTPNLEGENAGVVDLGFGERIAFKMESHNHPSFIEPVQGAATGVGGILRDIFTMGARPIALANYLCFGQESAPRMDDLQKGVVHGISMYGNCVGVPTITGQTQYQSQYNQNILVNAMAVGYFAPEQKMARARAGGVGNWVVYVGAKTGRDGVHGASMASASFDEDTESKKPNVQIGDPYYEKLLIEACLEVLSKDLVVAMQDMGAAGLTSSSFEMASHGQVGLEIDLQKVPLRDPSMTPEEILLSESQERMLLICRPEHFPEIQKIFSRWNLDSTCLGTVCEKRQVVLKWGSETLTTIDPDLIVEKAPRYERPYEKWVSAQKVSSPNEIKWDLYNSSFKNKNLNWIYNQYDQRVGTRTARDCSDPIGMVQLDHSKRGLAVAVGCRADLMKMDAQLGALDAIYYPSFQMALSGAKVMAVTDCLNFGNPQKVRIMSEFVASVEALAQAAEELDAPVISGNVSFYNETLEQNIISTPATGLVGLRADVENLIPSRFVSPFESVILVKYAWAATNAFWAHQKNQSARFYLNAEAKPAEFILSCVGLERKIFEKSISVSSLRSVSLGGVATTVQKMSDQGIVFKAHPQTVEADLYKDELYQFVLTTSNEQETIEFLQDYFSEMSPFLSIQVVGQTTQGA